MQHKIFKLIDERLKGYSFALPQSQYSVVADELSEDIVKLIYPDQPTGVLANNKPDDNQKSELVNSVKVGFDKEQAAVFYKLPNMVSDLRFEVSTIDDDIVNDTMTAKLTGYFYSNMAEERDLFYDCERPSFFDWLFRRRKRSYFNLKVKDLLSNPPKVSNTSRLYVVSEGVSGDEFIPYIDTGTVWTRGEINVEDRKQKIKDHYKENLP